MIQHLRYAQTRLSLVYAFACMLLLSLLLVVPASASTYSAFATKQIRSNDLSAFTKWTGVLSRYDVQHARADEQCRDDMCESHRWEKLLTSLEGKPEREQIKAVNDFFNTFNYVNDIDNWGIEDYWNTPYELMSRGGDCEDYAIAKYISLKRLGISASSMRVMVVKDMNLKGQMHAVLEVKIEETAYILDNQARQVAAEANIYHYRPLYAINENAWWAFYNNS